MEKKLTKEEVVLLCRAIDKAQKEKAKLYFNNYNEEDREDGRPDIVDFYTENWEDEDCQWEEYAKSIDESSPKLSSSLSNALPVTPPYSGEGCNDLVIDTGKNQYYVWYSDDYEHVIYKSAIKDYLAA